jgi:threonine synthase
MKYYSLNKQSPLVDFREATLRGQAPDRGLYFPEYLPEADMDLVRNIEQLSNEEIALRVIAPYTGDTIPVHVLQQIVRETIGFDVPLVSITPDIFSLELFHGPTLAFKDIGARFMSRCIGYFSKDKKGKTTVLVATSGDTGGAVANGFFGVEGVDVVILYPSGKVSEVQEKQLTTLGGNIHALEVNGTFDECQQMVKDSFADPELNQRISLTSANSINVARWLPQQFYYFFMWKQWPDKMHAPVVSVPSGNFGNLCAGLLAQRTGLPVKHFIAACNANDTVPRFMKDGAYRPGKAVATLSNAMDVGDPSNFVRILELFAQEPALLKEVMGSDSVSDDETCKTLIAVFLCHHYLLDPHGAVAFTALERYLAAHPGEKGVILETAHPVKFYNVIEPLTGQKVPVPAGVAEQLKRPKQVTRIGADSGALKEFLLDR